MNNKYIHLGDNKIAPDTRAKDGSFTVISDTIIKVNGSHKWEDFQPLEKDIDFVIAESYLKEGKIIEAIPLSKPNTDVKQNLVASNSANGIDCCDAPVSCTNTDEQEKIKIMDLAEVVQKSIHDEIQHCLNLKPTLVYQDVFNSCIIYRLAMLQYSINEIKSLLNNSTIKNFKN